MARTVAVNLVINGVQKVVAGFDAVGAAGASAGKTLEKHAQSADKLGSSMLKMGAVAAGGMALVVKAAIDWQSEWTGVAKTVNGTTDQLNALQGQLRQMAKDIPASAREIAGVAEAAGQLGVATGNVAAFTRTMIDLGNTTNLTADEAASSLAQFMNIMGTAGADVDRLGAAVVALGNNGASTERDIVQMGLRIAGAGNQIGLTEAQTLAFASALSSVGIDAEAGGTAISQVFLKIDAAVRAGGESLALLAQTSGMSSEEFAQAWGTNAAGATDAFLKGLNKVQSAGGSVSAVLSDLGIDAIRQSDAIRRLAGAGDLLTESLKTGESAWSANSALVIEATKRYQTAESQITMSWNRINDAAITVGGKVLPVVAGLAEGVGRLADGFGSIPGPVLSVVASLGSSVAVIGLVGGGLLKLASAGVEARKAAQDMAVAFPNASAKLTTFGKNAIAAGVAVAAMGAAYAAAKAAGIENMHGGIDDAAGAMAKLSGSTDLAGANLDAFFQDAKGMWGSKSLVGGVDSLTTAFTRVSQNDPFRNGYDGFQGFLMGLVGAKSEAALVTEQFSKLDKGLTAMSSGGATEQAAAAFKKVAEAAKDISPQRLIELFPEYAAQVRAAGTAVGYTYSSSQELAKAMQGELPAGMSASQQAAAKTGKAFEEAKVKIDDLVDSLFAAASAALKTSGTAIGFEASIDDLAKLTAGLTTKTKTLNIDTEAGRENRTALDNMAISSQAYIEQLTRTGAETSVTTAATQRAHDEFVKSAIAMGATKDQAEALAKQYGLIPPDVKSKITAEGASEARGSVEDLKASITTLPPSWQSYIISKLNTEGVEAAYKAKSELEKHPATLTINTVFKTGSLTGVSGFTMADGGLVDYYAKGGLREQHVAQIAPAGSMRVWAEPETGGEAYIPLAREKWERSRAIWWQTGQHLGMVAHADGAVYTGGRSVAPSVNVGSPTANVQVILDGRELRHEMRVTYSEESAKQASARNRGGR